MIDGKTAIEISLATLEAALTALARRPLLRTISTMALLVIVLLAGITLQVGYGLRPR